MTDTPDRFEIERVLFWAGFSEFRRVSGLLVVADHFDPERRTGIYVLRFRDGSYYVGKATDVTSRYRDHRDSKDPIEEMAFREVSKRNLDRVEQDTICALECLRVPLKNIALTRGGASPDRLSNAWATDEELRHFSTDRSWNDLTGAAIDDPVRRSKLHDRFQQLVSRPDAATIVEAFGLYVLRCIPFPARTVYRRWVISALPGGYYPHALANLSIGWQWACVAFEGDDGPFLQVYARGSVLKRAFGRNLENLAGCEVHVATEVMGGTDQLRLVCRPAELSDLLSKAPVVYALREVAIDLMQRSTPYTQFHCFDLGDAVLARARSMAG